MGAGCQLESVATPRHLSFRTAFFLFCLFVCVFALEGEEAEDAREHRLTFL